MQRQTRISSGNQAADRKAAQGQVRDGLAGNRFGHGKERVSREADVQKGEAYEKPRPMLKAKLEYSLQSSFSHIASAIGKSQRTVARHISILKKLGLVAVERRGNLAPLIHFRKEAFGQEELDLCLRLGCHDTAMALIGMCHDKGIDWPVSQGKSVMTRGTKSPASHCDDMTQTCHCHDTDMPSGVMTRSCHDRGRTSVDVISPRLGRQNLEDRMAFCNPYILNDLSSSTCRYLVPLIGMFGGVFMTPIISITASHVSTCRPCRDSVMTLSRQCHDTPPSSLAPLPEGGGIKGGGSSLKDLKSESEISDLVHSGNPRRLPVTPNVENLIEGDVRVFPPFPTPISPPRPPRGDSGLFSPECGEGIFVVGAATESPLPCRDLGDFREFPRETPESLVPYGDCAESGESSQKTPESLVPYGDSEISREDVLSGSGSSYAPGACSDLSQDCPSFAHNWPITGRDCEGSGSPLADGSGASEAKSGAFSGMSCGDPVVGGSERSGGDGSCGGSDLSRDCPSFARNWPITGRDGDSGGSPLDCGLGSFKANSGDSVAGRDVGGVDVVHVLMRVKAPAVKAPASSRQKDELRRLFEEAGGWSRWTEGELLEAAGRFAEWAKGSKKRVDWSLFLRRGPGSWTGSCRDGGGSSGGRSGASRASRSYLQPGAAVIRSEAAGRGGEIADLEASIRHLDRRMVYLEIELRGEEKRWREYNEYLVEECGLPPRPKPSKIIEMESRLQEIRQRLSELRGKLGRCLKE